MERFSKLNGIFLKDQKNIKWGQNKTACTGYIFKIPDSRKKVKETEEEEKFRNKDAKINYLS